MKKIVLLTVLMAFASSASAMPLSHFGHGGAPAPAKVIRASLECLNDGLGQSFGSCPSLLKQCKNECYEGYEDDVLRCMSGAGGILVEQRAICQAKATAVYGFCLKNCSDQYG